MRDEAVIIAKVAPVYKKTAKRPVKIIPLVLYKLLAIKIVR